MVFCPLGVLFTKHFVHWGFCLLGFWSTGGFIYCGCFFTRGFVHCGFCLLEILSTEFCPLGFCPLLVLSTGCFVHSRFCPCIFFTGDFFYPLWVLSTRVFPLWVLSMFFYAGVLGTWGFFP